MPNQLTIHVACSFEAPCQRVQPHGGGGGATPCQRVQSHARQDTNSTQQSKQRHGESGSAGLRGTTMRLLSFLTMQARTYCHNCVLGARYIFLYKRAFCPQLICLNALTLKSQCCMHTSTSDISSPMLIRQTPSALTQSRAAQI